MGTARVSRLGYNLVFGGLLQGLCAKSSFATVDQRLAEGVPMKHACEFSPMKKRSGEFDGHQAAIPVGG
jgi:hypothetical protein